MTGDVQADGRPCLDLVEPDEWDLDVRLGELDAWLVECGHGCGCLDDFIPTGGGGTCNTQNDTCRNTCAATCPATCQATCPATCRATCQATCRATCRPTCGCGPTDAPTCRNTHCFTCRSNCHTP